MQRLVKLERFNADQRLWKSASARMLWFAMFSMTARWPAWFLTRFLLGSCLFAIACYAQSGNNASVPSSPEFTHPQRVAILGYDGDAMEPFLTRDGKYLFLIIQTTPK